MKQSKSTSLNRSISDVSWNSLITKIQYNSEMRYVDLRENHPAYSSQRCSCCGYIERGNRLSQSDFLYRKCGFQTNADLNTGRNQDDYDQWSPEQKAMISEWKSESLSVA